MNRKFKIFISIIIIGIIITNLIQLPLPEYLIKSDVMIKSVLLSFVWFMIFVGLAYLSFQVLSRKKQV